MKNTSLLLIGISVLYMVGCTTSIKTSKIINNNSIVKGVVYYLPRSDIVYNAKYKINECTTENIDIEISLESVETKVVRDESSTFLLDYTLLSSSTKNTDFSVKFYDNGTIKSINLDTDDRTSEIIGSATNALTSLAMANIPGGFEFPGAVAPHVPYLCSQDVKTALDEEANLKSKLETKLDDLNVVVDAIKALRNDNQIDLTVLDAKLMELDGLKKKYDEAKKDYVKNQSILMFKQSFEKPDNYKNDNNEWAYTLMADSEYFEEWVSNSVENQESPVQLDDKYYKKNKEGVIIKKPSYIDYIREKTKLLIDVTPDDTNITSTYSSATTYSGIIYRIPVIGTVSVKLASGEQMHKKQYSLPGLGQIAYIPYSNKEFEENNLQVSFNESGVITELVYKTKSPAERIAKTFESVAGKVAEYKEAKRKKPLTDLQAQVEYQKVLNEYKTLSKEPDDELEKLKLEYELRELASKLDTLSTEELSRELQRIKIEQEIMELEK